PQTSSCSARAPSRPPSLARISGLAIPWIVGAEIPDVPFQVAARIAAAVAGLLLNVEHNLGACRLRPGAVGTNILGEQVADLGFGPADVVRLRHQLVEG